MASQAEIDKFLGAILGFESGGDPTAGGLFGYIDSTWAGYGGYAHARDAPAEVQWAKARADVAAKLARYGGDWRLVAMSWYLPAAAADPALRDTVPAPEAGNTKTPNEYADLVMSRFTGQAATSGEGTRVPNAAPGAKKSQQDILDYIAENYPDVYGLLSIDPQVKAVLLRAAEKEYTPAKLRSELAKTSWWQKTARSAREWDANYAQDRATGEQLLRQSASDIAAQAARLGVSLTQAQIRSLALNVRRNGWTDQMVRETLAAYWRKASKPNAGVGTATVDELRALAAQYGVQVSDNTLEVWTQRIVGGRADPAAFRSYLIKQAQSLFPTIASDISEGQTVRDYFDPYVQAAARILGVNPEDVDLSDSKWRRALVQVDPATGKRVPMTLDQWEAELRTNSLYGFDSTTNGRATGAEFVSGLLAATGQRR